MTLLPAHVRFIGMQPLQAGKNSEMLLTLQFKSLSPGQLVSIQTLFSREDVLQIHSDESIYVVCTQSKLEALLSSSGQPETCPDIMDELHQMYQTVFPSEAYCWKYRDGEMLLDAPAKIMGIVNVTPDSFSDGGDYFSRAEAIRHALNLIEAGADLIDVGGESTRPGSQPVSLKEELARVLPVIEGLRKESLVPISIDTYKAEVAREALKAGANIVNDISGGRFDSKILDVVSEFGAGLILMHIKGRPRTMQMHPYYEDVVEEILEFLSQSAVAALNKGILREQIVLDPGIGFGKRWFDNYDLINRLQEFKILGFPLLIGASRKSFLGKILAVEPKKREEATQVANTLAFLNGAHIIRVHNVEATKKALQIAAVFKGRSVGMEEKRIEEKFNA